MNWRERFLTLLEHEEPDRIPFDVWCSPAFLVKLRNQLGEEKLVNFSRDLWLGIRGAGPTVPEEFARKCVVHEPFVHYGTGIRVDQDTIEDEWGIRRRLTATRTESRVVYSPLKDADAESLDNYLFSDPNAPGRLRMTKDEVEKFKEEGYWVVGGFGIDTFWCQAWYLRGFKQLTIDLYANPEFVEKLMGKLLGYYEGIGKHLVELGVDQVNMADDVATQTEMIVSPRLWRKYIKPCYQKLTNILRPKVKYIKYHSDGDIRLIIPDLIEMDVNILNPIQPDCIDPAELKSLYGDRLTLWGGLSVQDTLPHGTVNDVEKEVKRTIESCAPGGGFVLGTSNNVTQDTPIENFLAMYEAAEKYGRYPIR